jgi:DnaK suppressor protein
MKELQYYQHKLEAERTELEEELLRLGVQNPKNPDNWEVKKPDIEVERSDENEAADRAEELHIDSIVLDELATRYRAITSALARIDDGTYGTCVVSGKPIEEDRLEANPAASTCKEHMESGPTSQQ